MWYSRLKHLWRHLFEILPYLTFTKGLNLILNLFEKHFRFGKLHSLPFAIKIEPTAFCQLKCSQCAHSNPSFIKQFSREGDMNSTGLREILDPLKKKLLWVSLSHRGEPLLNKNLIEFIEIIHQFRIGVSFPTNFSVRMDDSAIARLGKSGLDKLYVSLDGASINTYVKYRKGGNFNLVLSNVKRLSEFKMANRLKRPKIVWKFIVFDHNVQEIEVVKKNYKMYGFDTYELVHDHGGDIIKQERNKEVRKRIQKRKGCYWLWNFLVIESDGEIKPCCNHRKFNIGNAFETRVNELWNNKRLVDMRQGFRKQGFPHEIDEICKGCYELEY